MNPGYLSYVLMTCLIILLSSGWRLQIVGHVNRWMVMLFIGLWFILMPFSWNISPQITIHLSIILIIALTIAVYQSSNSWTQWIQLSLFSIILSTWHGFMLYDQRWSHAYLIAPALDVAIVEALLTAGFIKNPLQQVTVISWGVMIGILLDQLWSELAHIEIGHARAWDQLFIAIILTRFVSLLTQWSQNKLYSR